MASVPNQPGSRHGSGRGDSGDSKDGLGGLVGGGPSKVGVDAAMRARDVARPSEADLAAAERDLVIRHAAARIESRPLPQGITPAAPVPRPDEPSRSAKPGHPVPRPPKQKDSGQAPGATGSEPERS